MKTFQDYLASEGFWGELFNAPPNDGRPQRRTGNAEAKRQASIEAQIFKKRWEQHLKAQKQAQNGQQ